MMLLLNSTCNCSSETYRVFLSFRLGSWKWTNRCCWIAQVGNENTKIVRTTGSDKRIIYRIVRGFKQTGRTTDRRRRGRSTIVTTLEHIKKARCLIRHDPKRSMRKIVKKLGIGKFSVNIVKKVENVQLQVRVRTLSQRCDEDETAEKMANASATRWLWFEQSALYRRENL